MAGNVTPGDPAGFPVIINQPGSYRLASNLNVKTTYVGPTNSGIVIQSNNVTLDLNGFTVTGSADYGIYSSKTGVTVMNGTVSNFNLDGIKLDSRCHIEKVQVLSNGRDGVYCSTGSLITGNRVADNATLSDVDTWSGIFAGANSIISNNVVANNRGNGIAGVGLVINNVIFGNGFGINGFNPGNIGYDGNVLTGNDSNVYGAVSLGRNICDATPCP